MGTSRVHISLGCSLIVLIAAGAVWWRVGPPAVGARATSAAATVPDGPSSPAPSPTVARVGVTALAAVLVPGQVRQPRLDVEGFDETLGAHFCAAMIVACQPANPLQAVVVQKRSECL